MYKVTLLYGQPADAVFTNARGQPLSRDGVRYILTQHVKNARATCPSLKTERVSDFVHRHPLHGLHHEAFGHRVPGPELATRNERGPQRGALRLERVDEARKLVPVALHLERTDA